MLCPYDNLVFKHVFHPNENRCNTTLVGWAEKPALFMQVKNGTAYVQKIA
ncbi:hypothetical protein NSTC745_05425 [Nostoc sp. DSM 114161]|jgi:hypothetical protein